MKLYLGVFMVLASWVTITLGNNVPTETSYSVKINTPQMTKTIPESQVYLMKVVQRISSPMIMTPEQRRKADTVMQMATQNFQKCDDEYVKHSLVGMYRACLGTYTRLAMSQIRAIELENRSEFLTPSNTIISSHSGSSYPTQISYSAYSMPETQRNYNENNNYEMNLQSSSSSLPSGRRIIYETVYRDSDDISNRYHPRPQPRQQRQQVQERYYNVMEHTNENSYERNSSNENTRNNNSRFSRQYSQMHTSDETHNRHSSESMKRDQHSNNDNNNSMMTIMTRSNSNDMYKKRNSEN